MNPIIGCDAHRRYSLFAVLDTPTLSVEQTRVNHQPGAILEFLSGFPEGTPVALETVGNYYWIVDEIEQAGCVPLLAHAAKAKVIMGNINTRAGHLRQDRQARCKRSCDLGPPRLLAHRLATSW